MQRVNEKKECSIHYGEQIVKFKIPEGWNLILEAKPKSVMGVVDEEKEILRAIRNPIGTKKLSEIVGTNKKVVIIIYDRYC